MILQDLIHPPITWMEEHSGSSRLQLFREFLGRPDGRALKQDSLPGLECLHELVHPCGGRRGGVRGS